MVSRISVAQAATIINATITFVQFTTSLSIIILLVHFMPKINTALSWSSTSRTLHSSLWPSILRTDSSSTKTSAGAVLATSHLAMLTTVLVALAGVLLPLGLSQGPPMSANPHQLEGRYVPDTSPLGLSTRPDRESFVYGRRCTDGFGPGLLPCPGNDNPNTTTIAPSVRKIFNSTPHGPFAIQYRKFYEGDTTQNCSIGVLGTGQTFILENDTSVAEGVIIDISTSDPGVGFWDQSLPDVKSGATWSEDVLWLKPETQCVDTNLTIDYLLMHGLEDTVDSDFTFNITDNGAFFNLPREPPFPPFGGQQIDLRQHAYIGGAYNNLFTMTALNVTRESSFVGASYVVNSTLARGEFFFYWAQSIGYMNILQLSYPNGTEEASSLCQGYGTGDPTNITNVHVSCGIVFGPPLRTDGGDSRVFSLGSRWRQGIYACASATSASIQSVTFSTNSTSDFQNIQVSREPSKSDVLWATEKTNLTTSEVDLLWGRVDDRYENDPSLWTIRVKSFYLPAGNALPVLPFPIGLPASAHGSVWDQVYSLFGFDKGGIVLDYSGKSNFALQEKFQSLISQNATLGNAHFCNLIWTDIMVNNLMGTQVNHSLLVSGHLETLQYDFRYGVPGFVLFIIWIPSFFGAIFLLATRSVTFGYISDVLNHTSVGRVVVRTSALRVRGRGDAPGTGTPQSNVLRTSSSNTSFLDIGSGHTRNYPEDGREVPSTGGDIKVTLELGQPRKVKYGEEIELLGSQDRF